MITNADDFHHLSLSHTVQDTTHVLPCPSSNISFHKHSISVSHPPRYIGSFQPLFSRAFARSLHRPLWCHWKILIWICKYVSWFERVLMYKVGPSWTHFRRIYPGNPAVLGIPIHVLLVTKLTLWPLYNISRLRLNCPSWPIIDIGLKATFSALNGNSIGQTIPISFVTNEIIIKSSLSRRCNQTGSLRPDIASEVVCRKSPGASSVSWATRKSTSILEEPEYVPCRFRLLMLSVAIIQDPLSAKTTIPGA